MKSIISLIILAVSSLTMMGQSLVEQANAAYNKDNYNGALELYLKAEKQQGNSSELYYNIANSYYRLGNMGKAVLYYERSLVLDPTNEDAQSNLDFVKDKLQLKTDRGESFIADWLDSVISTNTSNAWAVWAAVFFVVLLCSILLYVFANGVLLRKIGFFGGGVICLLMLCSLICAFRMRAKVQNHNSAIVMVPSATLSTSPRTPKDKTEEAFLLSEGSKVTIVDSVENKNGLTKEKWFDVKADDTHRAWIRDVNIQKI